MTGENLIRPARPAEAEQLSELALRSKGFWGYDAEFLEACREELSVDANYIGKHPVYVIEHETVTAGFYSLEEIDKKEVGLGLLFVEPTYIGNGLGRQLIEHAKQQAVGANYETILIQGDPYATHFYLAAGGEPAGTSPSGSISGRMLPLFRIDLVTADFT